MNNSTHWNNLLKGAIYKYTNLPFGFTGHTIVLIHLWLFTFLNYNIYKKPIPSIKYLTFSLLIWRYICESKHLSKLFKLFSSKSFCEDVCNWLTYGIVYQLNDLGLYMMSNQIVFHAGVLCSIMESTFVNQLDCRSVVNQKWSNIHLFLLQIF